MQDFPTGRQSVLGRRTKDEEQGRVLRTLLVNAREHSGQENGRSFGGILLKIRLGIGLVRWVADIYRDEAEDEREEERVQVSLKPHP